MTIPLEILICNYKPYHKKLFSIISHDTISNTKDNKNNT